jgi:hypothetical protein
LIAAGIDASPGQGVCCTRLLSRLIRRHVFPGCGSAADGQQPQPADQHVCRDAMSEAVEDRPQRQLSREITEAAFGLAEVL